MTSAVVRQLILKDLYLVRWMIAGSIAAGAAALAIMPLGSVSAYVGGVSFFCVLIILNIVLVMHNVVQERKDKVLLFTLSLPISTTQYVWAKVAANALAFVSTWLVLTIAAAVVIDVTALPNGILPYWLAILGYILLYYCILLAVGVARDGTAWHAAVITIGNISVNFFVPFMLSLPSVVRHREGPVAVWTPDVAAIIAAEIVAGAAAIALAVYLRSRRPDFV